MSFIVSGGSAWAAAVTHDFQLPCGETSSMVKRDLQGSVNRTDSRVSTKTFL